jgi:hypothetical protein
MYKFSYTGIHVTITDELGQRITFQTKPDGAEFARRLVERANANDAEFDRKLVQQASAMLDEIPTIPGVQVKRVKIICQTETH